MNVSKFKLQNDSIKIDPGKYRTYIAPAGVADIIDMFSWGGISEASLQQKDSALLKMREKNISLSPLIKFVMSANSFFKDLFFKVCLIVSIFIV